jgi:hypothetical protein
MSAKAKAPEIESTTPKVVEIKRTCFANLHMTLEEFALWTVCLAMSYHSGVLYFDGRELAKRFEGVAKNRIYRTRDGLIKKGWFVLLRERRRAETGIWESAQYRVLTAEEWAKKHPHTCKNIDPGSITGQASSPTSGTGDQGLLRNYPGSITQLSCPTSGTYLTEENLTEEKREKRHSRSRSRSDNRGKTKTPTESMAEKEVRSMADQVVAIALGENPGAGAGFNSKSKAAIQEVIRNDRPTYDELLKIVPSIVRLMDDFQLKNAGGAIAASLSGHILAIRKKVQAEQEDEIDLAAANKYIDEQIAIKKAQDEAERAAEKAEDKRMRETHWPDDGLCGCERCHPEHWIEKAAASSGGALPW